MVSFRFPHQNPVHASPYYKLIYEEEFKKEDGGN